jgi:hypothetical protein
MKNNLFFFTKCVILYIEGRGTAQNGNLKRRGLKMKNEMTNTILTADDMINALSEAILALKAKDTGDTYTPYGDYIETLKAMRGSIYKDIA